MKAVVLLSGGIDSTICALLAGNNLGFSELTALNITYGQKHVKECLAAEKIAAHLGLAKFENINLSPELFAKAGSTLIDKDINVPDGPYPKEAGPVSTYVPFRNGIFISVAAAFALKVGAETIYFGAHAEDAMNWAYPDCTPEFLGAMKNATWVGSYYKVRLITPLEWLNKAKIVELGKNLKAPFELTWSCYKGEDAACGVCPTCLSRLEAFKANDLEDPIKYREREKQNV